MSTLPPPPDTSLSLFVYGALKPGMPAYERIREFVQNDPEPTSLKGELYVRDGLPLLFLSEASTVDGFVLRWQHGAESLAYAVICDFEPSEHYKWEKAKTVSGLTVNVLGGRHRNKGNPQPLGSTVWRLTEDPAFSEGLQAVKEVVQELESSGSWTPWTRFFRAQMAYLLLWSILERLSALSFGPRLAPMKRVDLLHTLPGMPELIRRHIRQEPDRVTDSRNPQTSYSLSVDNPAGCFQYYYQVRNNLSHRGKAIFNEIDKVKKSLKELIRITDEYLQQLRVNE